MSNYEQALLNSILEESLRTARVEEEARQRRLQSETDSSSSSSSSASSLVPSAAEQRRLFVEQHQRQLEAKRTRERKVAVSDPEVASSSSSSSSSSASVSLNAPRSVRPTRHALQTMPSDLTGKIAEFLVPRNAASFALSTEAAKNAVTKSFRAKDRDLRPSLQQTFYPLHHSSYGMEVTVDERKQIRDLFTNTTPITTQADFLQITSVLNPLLVMYLLQKEYDLSVKDIQRINNQVKVWLSMFGYEKRFNNFIKQGMFTMPLARAIIEFASLEQVQTILAQTRLLLTDKTFMPYADETDIKKSALVTIYSDLAAAAIQHAVRQEQTTCPLVLHYIVRTAHAVKPDTSSQNFKEFVYQKHTLSKAEKELLKRCLR